MQMQNIACSDFGSGDFRPTRSTQTQIVAECLKSHLFLMEKEIVLPSRLKRMIHGLVNQELE